MQDDRKSEEGVKMGVWSRGLGVYFVITSLVLVFGVYIFLVFLFGGEFWEYRGAYVVGGVLNFFMFLISFFALFVILRKVGGESRGEGLFFLIFYMSVIGRFLVFLIYIWVVFATVKEEGKVYMLSYLAYFMVLLKVEVFYIYKGYKQDRIRASEGHVNGYFEKW